jgi:hypothetical protein
MLSVVLVLFLVAVGWLVVDHWSDLMQNYRYTTRLDVSRIRYTLLTVIDVLNHHQVPYMLAEGSLLGVIRDHALIPWDTDGDLIILHPDKQHVLRILQQHLPADIVVSAGCCVSRCVETQKNNWVDLFFYTHDGSSVFPTDWLFRWSDSCLSWLSNYFRVASFPAQAIFPLRDMEWEGRRVKIPQDTTLVLEMQYGPDWKTPKPRAEWEDVFLNTQS